ncbi:MAG: hypothetical protein Q9167_000063 [Letrouitia subvulpina]
MPRSRNHYEYAKLRYYPRFDDSISSRLFQPNIQLMEHDYDAKDRTLQMESQELQVQLCVICLDSVSEKAVAKPCGKLDVLSVDYNWRSTRDFQTYQVAQLSSLPDSRHTSNRYLRPDSLPRARRTQVYPEWTSWQRPTVEDLPSRHAAVRRRRKVYRFKLYSLHVGSNRISGYRYDPTPQQFSLDAELVSRARKWIRRELQVFEFLYRDSEDESQTRKPNNAEILLEYIIAILKTVDIKDHEGRAEDMIQEFLGRENTVLFLHELKSWLRSPYESLEEWDRNVQYNDRRASVPRQTQGTSSRVKRRRHLQPDQRRSIFSHTPTVERSLRRPDCYRPSRDSAHRLSRRRTIQPNLTYDRGRKSSQH